MNCLDAPSNDGLCMPHETADVIMIVAITVSVLFMLCIVVFCCSQYQKYKKSCEDENEKEYTESEYSSERIASTIDSSGNKEFLEKDLGPKMPKI